MVRYLNAVQSVPNQDVVEVLSKLLREAQEGKIDGLAYGVLEPGNKFSADVVGRCTSSVLLSFGIVRALEQAVARLIG